MDKGESKVAVSWTKAAPMLSLLAFAGAAIFAFGLGDSPQDALLRSTAAVFGIYALALAVLNLLLESGQLNIFTGTKWSASGHVAELAFLSRANAIFANVPYGRFEPVTVTRYSEGEYQRQHLDARVDELINAGFNDSGCGQRMAQVIVCLRAPEAGGETKFFGHTFSDWPERAVKHVVGQALVFPTAALNGMPDRRYLHSVEAVLRGQKWIVGTWLTQRSRVTRFALPLPPHV